MLCSFIERKRLYFRRLSSTRHNWHNVFEKIINYNWLLLKTTVLPCTINFCSCKGCGSMRLRGLGIRKTFSYTIIVATPTPRARHHWRSSKRESLFSFFPRAYSTINGRRDLTIECFINVRPFVFCVFVIMYSLSYLIPIPHALV